MVSTSKLELAYVDTNRSANATSSISLKVANGVAIALMYADETWVPPDRNGSCTIS